jgi:hypothetical protein
VRVSPDLGTAPLGGLLRLRHRLRNPLRHVELGARDLGAISFSPREALASSRTCFAVGLV